MYMLLRFQRAAVRGNYETGNQAFSMRLRFLTTRGSVKLLDVQEKQNSISPQIRIVTDILCVATKVRLSES